MSKFLSTLSLVASIFLTYAAPSCTGSVPITQFTSPPDAACRIDELGRADGHCTPGKAAQTPDVLSDAPTYRHTLCAPSDGNPATETWVQARRPPTSYTNRLKATQMRQYGLVTPDGAVMPLSSVEEDHIIPLALDGDPQSPLNLYPQPWHGTYGAHEKDKDERRLWRAVCSGTLTLEQAQAEIVREWVH